MAKVLCQKGAKGGYVMLKKKYLSPNMDIYLMDEVGMNDVVSASGTVDVYDIWG